MDTPTPSNPPPAPQPASNNKVLAGVLGILIGAFGVHKFVLGYTLEGIIMLGVSLVGFLLCGIPTLVMGAIGFVEGIIYLTKADDQFVATYVDNKRGWF